MGYVSKVRKDISIHAPHARSDPALFAVLAKFVGISIHAPHARSDSFDTGMMSPYVNFNPRSSCEERPQVVTARCSAQNFNPRSSCEERLAMIVLFVVFDDFNPRSSCEERRQSFDHSLATVRISIHAPHARSDLLSRSRGCRNGISIHAPHARSDGYELHGNDSQEDFNPRSSCEERLSQPCSYLWYVLFQSTLLMRGATSTRLQMVNDWQFQSTLLMRGATRAEVNRSRLSEQFQSTLLMRGAT